METTGDFRGEKLTFEETRVHVCCLCLTATTSRAADFYSNRLYILKMVSLFCQINSHFHRRAEWQESLQDITIGRGLILNIKSLNFFKKIVNESRPVAGREQEEHRTGRVGVLRQQKGKDNSHYENNFIFSRDLLETFGGGGKPDILCLLCCNL